MASTPPELDWNLGADKLYWDPVPWIERLPGQPMVGYQGQWDERNWLNVPGPIYGAMTDTCWVGRMRAPRHVLYGDTDQEFLFRQPRTLGELRQVMDAAGDDPFGGRAYDGDRHWTYAAVREWWCERSRIADWIHRQAAEWASLTWAWMGRDLFRDAETGLRDYSDYVRGDLEGAPARLLLLARGTTRPRVGRPPPRPLTLTTKKPMTDRQVTEP